MADSFSSAAVVGSKVASMVLLAAIAVVGGIVPIYLKRMRMGTVMSMCNAFAGGAFMALGMFHILPDAVVELEEVGLVIMRGSFNVAFILVFVGYTSILVCETVIFDPATSPLMKECHHHHSTALPVSAALSSPSLIPFQSRRSSTPPTFPLPTPSVVDASTTESIHIVTVDGTCQGLGDYPSSGTLVVSASGPGKLSCRRLLEGKRTRVACNGKEGSTCSDSEEGIRELEGILRDPRRKAEGVVESSDTVRTTVPSSSADSSSPTTCISHSNSSQGDICKLHETTEFTVHTQKLSRDSWSYMFSSGAFCMMLALAVHGLFEGIVVGTASDVTGVWMTTLVIFGHKWAESFALMTQFVEAELGKRLIALLIGVFVLSSPVGIAVGMVAASEGRMVAGICNALGAGTVFYVASEIIMEVFGTGGKWRYIKLVVYFLGACVVLLLTWLEVVIS